jgi:hypothetical protein
VAAARRPVSFVAADSYAGPLGDIVRVSNSLHGRAHAPQYEILLLGKMLRAEPYLRCVRIRARTGKRLEYLSQRGQLCGHHGAVRVAAHYQHRRLC